MALREAQLQSPEHPVSLTRINRIIKKFNRNTTWVAAGLLGSVIFAALMVAFQERQAQADDLTQDVKKNSGDLLPNSSLAATSVLPGLIEKSTSEITSGQSMNVDRNLTPETKTVVQASATPTAQQTNSAPVIHTKIPNVRLRSSGHPRYLGVKARLIALWHQSLQHEESRGWKLSSNSARSQKEKVNYTATTSH